MPPGPERWAERYAAGDTPWDLGKPHPELVRRLAAGQLSPPPGGRALVPGCGRGHDAGALAQAGWKVVAIDVVDGLAREVGPRLERHGGRFVAGDALAWEPPAPFHLLFEHTFFCALDPSERPRYGAMARRALAPGGLLVAVVFPCGKPASAGGPPYGFTPADLEEVLGPEFVRLRDEPCRHRARDVWDERWTQWVRRPVPAGGSAASA
ncbi:MAG: methyltransferase domain-containing protein [Acidobacteria bacterium]|nr:MAG: methyltransferase domain-containing protein [Acidobacteriota bacterium]